MNRRQVLATLGVGGATLVAGCSSGESAPDEPDEEIAYYAREGADENGAWVEEVQSVAVGDSEVGDGYDLVFDYELGYRSSDDPPSTIEENANWSAYYILKNVYDRELDLERAAIRAYVPTVDEQGNEDEAQVSHIQMDAETASQITWENIGADQIAPNADGYWFEPV